MCSKQGILYRLLDHTTSLSCNRKFIGVVISVNVPSLLQPLQIDNSSSMHSVHPAKLNGF